MLNNQILNSPWVLPTKKTTGEIRKYSNFPKHIPLCKFIIRKGLALSDYSYQVSQLATDCTWRDSDGDTAMWLYCSASVLCNAPVFMYVYTKQHSLCHWLLSSIQAVKICTLVATVTHLGQPSPPIWECATIRINSDENVTLPLYKSKLFFFQLVLRFS